MVLRTIFVLLLTMSMTLLKAQLYVKSFDDYIREKDQPQIEAMIQSHVFEAHQHIHDTSPSAFTRAQNQIRRAREMLDKARNENAIDPLYWKSINSEIENAQAELTLAKRTKMLKRTVPWLVGWFYGCGSRSLLV